MKKFYLILILFASWNFASAQKESQNFKNNYLKGKDLLTINFKHDFEKDDFSSLFTQTENSAVVGFIGNNYQRIRIKFISVSKDSLLAGVYNVYGKSMVKNNIDEFHGTIKITNIRKYKIMSLGVDDELKNKGLKGQFIILGDYSFFENKSKGHTGVFNGTFRSGFYLDKNNKYYYDDIEEYSDSYSNNQFVGQWTPYDSIISKRCNWGDFRIPNSGDFDIGAGEFSPDDKYLKNGWQSIRDVGEQSTKSKKAILIEEAKWWK